MLVAMDTSDFRAWSKSVEPTTIVKTNLKNPNNTKDCFLLPLSVKGIYTRHDFKYSGSENGFLKFFKSREGREAGVAARGKGNFLILLDRKEFSDLLGS